MNNSSIDSDQPISSFQDDKFGRKQFAWRIADLISNRKENESLSIGITAPWGEGKSSVLNMIEERLAHSNVRILKFNPWRFSDEESLLRNFYFDIARVLEVDLEEKNEKVGKVLKKLSWLLVVTVATSSLRYSLSRWDVRADSRRRAIQLSRFTVPAF